MRRGPDRGGTVPPMEIRTLRDSELDQAFELNKDAFHQSEEQRDFFRRFVDPARMIEVVAPDFTAPAIAAALRVERV